jgi:hypothetical protein
MSDKKQPKKFRRKRRGSGVVKGVIEAVAECQAKGDFDYQRIIVCIADHMRESEDLARRCRVALSPVLRRNSRRCGPVAVMEIGAAGKRELLVAAVRAVNQRRAVVVLVTTGENFVKWHGRWEAEAGRIRRRTHGILKAGGMEGKNEG